MWLNIISRKDCPLHLFKMSIDRDILITGAWSSIVLNAKAIYNELFYRGRLTTFVFGGWVSDEIRQKVVQACIGASGHNTGFQNRLCAKKNIAIVHVWSENAF